MIAPTMPTLPPSCPVFPVQWTEAIAEAARAHTAEAYPLEAVGIVEAGEYVRLTNRSHTPAEDVALSDDDAIRAAGAEVFFHSHPDGLDCPSEADMIYQAQLGIPFVIQPWPVGPQFCFGPMLTPAPLIGRAFRHGVHDCYSTIADYYASRGVMLPYPARGWEWWDHGKDLYSDNFAGAGFVPIQIDEAVVPGDLLLFKFRYPVLMHGAVVTAPALLLHHLAGTKPTDYTRLSVEVPRIRLVRHAAFALRFSAGFPPP